MRHITNIISSIIAALLFVCVVVVGYVYINFTIVGERMDACNKVIKISNSKEKTSYILNWAKSAMKDADALRRLGTGTYVYAKDLSEFEITRLGIDWGYLGLSKEYAFVYFSGWVNKGRDYMEPDDIWSVAIGEGRDFVVIDLNEVPDYELKIRKKYSGQIHASNLTGAIAWCR